MRPASHDEACEPRRGLRAPRWSLRTTMKPASHDEAYARHDEAREPRWGLRAPRWSLRATMRPTRTTTRPAPHGEAWKMQIEKLGIAVPCEAFQTPTPGFSEKFSSASENLHLIQRKFVHWVTPVASAKNSSSYYHREQRQSGWK